MDVRSRNEATISSMASALDDRFQGVGRGVLPVKIVEGCPGSAVLTQRRTWRLAWTPTWTPLRRHCMPAPTIC